jgi:hypothetical protein
MAKQSSGGNFLKTFSFSENKKRGKGNFYHVDGKLI